MRLFILFILTPFFLFSQTQIGNDIDGEAAGDRSGYVSFSNDGTIVAIGGPGNDSNGTDAGYVRVFENVSGNWIQIGSDRNGKAAGDRFGESVCLSGDGTIIAVGASGNDDAGIDAGHVRVYQNISGTWTKIGETINGDASYHYFGKAVSLSDNGTTLSISGSNNTRIYENISGIWTQVGSDIDTDASTNTSTILSGDSSVVAVSELYYDSWWGNYSSHYIYKNISGTWTQIGDVLYSFTNSLSLSYDGSIIALPAYSSSGTEVTEVYENIGNVWTQIGNAIGSPGVNSSLSSNGSIIAIGGGSSNNEIVNIFRNINNDWMQIGTTINGVNFGDNFGSSLSLSASGNAVVIGANGYDGNGIDAGHVRVYDLSAILSTNDYALSQFKIYPNPAQDQFTIELNTSLELKRINIYNNLGQFVKSTSHRIVNTSGFSTGIYFVEVISNMGKMTKKLVINK